jgi:hypothetical protein
MKKKPAPTMERKTYGKTAFATANPPKGARLVRGRLVPVK